MFRKFTILLSFILTSTSLLAFTPAQAGGSEIEIVWWFWLCFASILIVGFFIWLVLVAGRRDVEAPPAPEPPMAGQNTQKADLTAGATASASKRVVDTTDATMAETKYVVTDPDAKYVKGSLTGEADAAVAESSQAESEVVAETEAMVEEVAAEVQAEETASASEEVEAVVTETEVVAEVAETTEVEAEVAVEETADDSAAVAAAAPVVEEKPAKKAPAKKKGRKSSKYGNGRDDLKKVEGIGPKIEGLLNADGIMTFEQLANANIERIQAVLDAAGPRYRTHKPDTWPEQSALCAKGDWDALEKLQDILDGGRRK